MSILSQIKKKKNEKKSFDNMSNSIHIWKKRYCVWITDTFGDSCSFQSHFCNILDFFLMGRIKADI